MTSPDNNGQVSYTVKELIQNLDEKFDMRVGNLDSKVDRVLLALSNKADTDAMNVLVRRVEVLERGEIKRGASMSTLQRVWLTVLSIATLLTPSIVALSLHK